jgi:universal stress protein A
VDQKIRNILVPLDRTAGSEAVLRTVAELARASGARVRLLHVAPDVQPVIVGDRVVRHVDEEIVRIRQEVQTYLESAATGLSQQIRVELAVRFGNPVEEIVEEAKASGMDLIAMASRRRAGVARLLRGSVAEQVERATRLPVLLVRYGDLQAA